MTEGKQCLDKYYCSGYLFATLSGPFHGFGAFPEPAFGSLKPMVISVLSVDLSILPVPGKFMLAESELARCSVHWLSLI